jgi:hypothetical protein
MDLASVRAASSDYKHLFKFQVSDLSQ